MVRDEQFSSETAPAAPVGVNADTNIYVTPAAPRPAPVVQPIPEVSPVVTPILTAPIAAPTAQAAPTTSPIPVQSVYQTQQTATQSESSGKTTSSSTVRQKDAKDAEYEAEQLTRKTVTKQTTTRTQDMDGPKVKKKTSVNWGGIVKGAAIVTAVVVVGVAAFVGVSSGASWLMTNPTTGSIIAGITEAVTPVIASVGNGIASAAGYLTEVPGIIKNFATGLFNLNTAATVGGAASAATGTAAAATLGGETIKAASKTMGMMAAGGAVAYTASHGMQNMDHTALLNQSQVTVMPAANTEVTTTITTDPGHAVATHHAASKASTDLATQTELLDQALHQHGHDHAAHNAHHAAELGLHAYELNHHNHANHAPASVNHDAQSSHQVDAPDTGSTDMGDISAPDVDVDENAMQRIGSRAQRWTDRTGKSTFANTVKSGGGYSAAVSANRDESRIKAPANDYVTEMAERKATAGETSLA